MKFIVETSRLTYQAELLAVSLSGQPNWGSARHTALGQFLWSHILILLLAHSPVLSELANGISTISIDNSCSLNEF